MSKEIAAHFETIDPVLASIVSLSTSHEQMPSGHASAYEVLARSIANQQISGLVARKIIEKVVEELKRKMQVQVEQAITGAIRKDRHSPRKVFRNLDLKTTLRRNLQNFDSESGKLLVDRVFFYAAERKKKPWHVIVVVDQSGSMLESAIFSAVMLSRGRGRPDSQGFVSSP